MAWIPIQGELENLAEDIADAAYAADGPGVFVDVPSIKGAMREMLAGSERVCDAEKAWEVVMFTPIDTVRRLWNQRSGAKSGANWEESWTFDNEVKMFAFSILCELAEDKLAEKIGAPKPVHSPTPAEPSVEP